MIRYFLFLCFFSILGCRSPKSNSNVSLERGDSTVIYLEEGQDHFLQKAQFNIRFDRVAADSRCPEGVNCVWSGFALIDLILTGTYTRPQHIQLANTLVAESDYRPDRMFNGYRIRMLDLAPYPSSTQPSKVNENYRAKIAVIRSDK